MELLSLGGPMMWPLFALSLVALAVIVERFMVIGKYRAPKGLTTFSNSKDVVEKAGQVEGFADFVKSVQAGQSESFLVINAEAVVSQMNRRLGLLSMIAKTATLMGLLGTILGMISAFAVISETTTGIDMNLLAQGLWQALITTATGLVIAIPTFVCLSWFEGRVADTAEFLTLSVNICVNERNSAG